MSVSNRIGIEIAAEVSGAKDLDALARELEDMAKLAEGDLAKAAKAAADRMRELGEQDAAVTAFTQLQAQATEGARALNAAAKEAESYGKQIMQAGPPTAEEAAHLQRLQTAATEAGKSFAAQQQAVAGAQGVLQRYGIAADGAQAAQQRIRQEAAQVRESVSALAPAYEKAGSAAVQSTKEQTAAIGEMEKRSAELGNTLTSVGKAMAGLFAAGKLVGYAKNAIQVADAYGQMAERIRMATGSSEEYDLVQERLLASANTTYRSLAEQQELYIQTADALRSMGYATDQVLDITDSFTYLLTTNAASADKAKSAINAYTKAVQAGKVDVNAWQSIMAATPSIVDAIAQSTGKTAAEIRQLGVTGKLAVADLNEGLRQSVEANKAATDGMVSTVEDAMTRLANTWSVYIGEANRGTQATQKIVQLVDMLSDNLDAVVTAATAAGEIMAVVWGIKAMRALQAYIAQLVIATKETQALMATTAAAGTRLGATLAAAGKVGLAAWVGWEIGTYLRGQFEEVEKAGIALAAGLHKAAVRVQGAWEMAQAVFTKDTIAEATGRMNARLRELDDTYADLFASVGRVEQAQQKAGQATVAAGAAAQTAQVQWDGLRTSYAEVADSLKEQAAELDKTSKLKVAEAQATETVARALGSEKDARAASANAAGVAAEQARLLAEQRQREVAVLVAERDALLAVGKELIAQDPIRAKQLRDLDHQISLRQKDAAQTLEQAKAMQLAAAAAQAEVEALKDNSGRVSELRAEWQRSREELERVREAKARGAATTEELARAEANATTAARLYRDALEDQQKTIAAKRDLQLADINVQGMEMRLAYEQQKAIYEVAKARGDEQAAMAAQQEMRRLEIQMLQLTAEAKRTEAQAARALAEAKKAELIAAGEYNGSKKLEVDAAIKAAEAKELDAKAAQVAADKLLALAASQGELQSKTKEATGAISEMENALVGLADRAAQRSAPGTEALMSMWYSAENAASKYAYAVTRVMWESVNWASVSRQQFATMSATANRLVDELRSLDDAQERLKRSSSGAASGLAGLQDRLLALNGTEEEIARARAQREKDELASKMALLEIEVRRMEILKDPTQAPELAAKREELALLQQQMGVLDTIHKKEQQQRDKSRREREAEEKRRKAEDKRREDERRREQSAPTDPTGAAPRPPAPAPAAPPWDGRSRDSFQPSQAITINVGNGGSYGPINTDSHGSRELERLMREWERGKWLSGK